MRRFSAFLLVGIGGFLVDAGITHLMLRWGYPPWVARLPAISCAVLFTWSANRTITYQVAEPKSIAELVRYVVAAGLLSGVNYVTFLAIMSQNFTALPALVMATALQVLLSFQVYKTLVFKPRSEQ